MIKKNEVDPAAAKFFCVWLLLMAAINGCGGPESKAKPQPAKSAKLTLAKAEPKKPMELEQPSKIDFTTIVQLHYAVMKAVKLHLPPGLTEAQFEAGAQKVRATFLGKGYCFTLAVDDVGKSHHDNLHYAHIREGLCHDLPIDHVQLAVTTTPPMKHERWPPMQYYVVHQSFRIVKLEPTSISKGSLIDFVGVIDKVSVTGRVADGASIGVYVNLSPRSETMSKKKQLSNTPRLAGYWSTETGLLIGFCPDGDLRYRLRPDDPIMQGRYFLESERLLFEGVPGQLGEVPTVKLQPGLISPQVQQHGIPFRVNGDTLTLQVPGKALILKRAKTP